MICYLNFCKSFDHDLTLIWVFARRIYNYESLMRILTMQPHIFILNSKCYVFSQLSVPSCLTLRTASSPTWTRPRDRPLRLQSKHLDSGDSGEAWWPGPSWSEPLLPCSGLSTMESRFNFYKSLFRLHTRCAGLYYLKRRSYLVK